MQIYTYPVGQLQANCYFLIENDKCLIIDPGDSADFICEKLDREQLELVGLVATHGHFDHIMAAGEIQMSYDVPFFIHKDDMFLVKRLNETAKYFLDFDPHALVPKNIKHILPGVFQVSGFKFHVISTPGHTPGSCCFYYPQENIVFTGDTIFKQGIGRYDLSYSNKAQLMESLQTLIKLPKETVILSGHGEETTIGEERVLY